MRFLKNKIAQVALLKGRNTELSTKTKPKKASLPKRNKNKTKHNSKEKEQSCRYVFDP